MKLVFVEPNALACTALYRGLTSHPSTSFYYQQISANASDYSNYHQISHQGQVVAAQFFVSRFRDSTQRLKLPMQAWGAGLLSGYNVLTQPLNVVIQTHGSQWLLPANTGFDKVQAACSAKIIADARKVVLDAWHQVELRLGFVSEKSLQTTADVLFKALQSKGVLGDEHKPSDHARHLQSCLELTQYLRSLEITPRKSMAGVRKNAKPTDNCLISSVPNGYNASYSEWRSLLQCVLAVRYPELVIETDRLLVMAPHVASRSYTLEPSLVRSLDASQYISDMPEVIAFTEAMLEQNQDITELTAAECWQKQDLDFALESEVEAYRTAAAMAAANHIPQTNARFTEVGRRFANGAQGLAGGF